MVQHTVEENVHRLAQQRASRMDMHDGSLAHGGGSHTHSHGRDALTVLDVASLLHASWQTTGGGEGPGAGEWPGASEGGAREGEGTA